MLQKSPLSLDYFYFGFAHIRSCFSSVIAFLRVRFIIQMHMLLDYYCMIFVSNEKISCWISSNRVSIQLSDFPKHGEVYKALN